MSNKKPVSFPFFLASLFYAPILSPYFPKTQFGSGIPDFGLFEACLYLWIMTLLLDLMQRTFSGQSLSRSVNRWLCILGVYTVIVLASISWSVESYSSSNVHDLFFTVLIPFLFAFLAKYYVRNPLVIKSLVTHAMVSCWMLSIIGCIHFVAHQGHSINELRAGFGGLANPNAMAIFLVMNVSIILYGVNSGLCSKKIAFISFFVIALGGVSTISRKGLVTFGMSFLIFFTLTRKIKLLLAFLLIFSAVIGVVVTQKSISQRYSNAAIDKEFIGKWNMTVAGWGMFTKKPVIGYGYKGYYNNFGRYFKSSFHRKYDAHNNYITALSNYGVLGFMPFILMFIYPVFSALRRSLRYRSFLPYVFLISLVLPFMANAWFAGGLMYLPVVTNLLYVYIVFFMYCSDMATEKVDDTQQ